MGVVVYFWSVFGKMSGEFFLGEKRNRVYSVAFLKNCIVMHLFFAMLDRTRVCAVLEIVLEAAVIRGLVFFAEVVFILCPPDFSEKEIF